jgi:septal ring factor EnvC (AmiA/AmiB activator)
VALPLALPAQAADARIRAQREELDRVRRERASLEQRMANLQGSVHDLRDELANLDRQRAATSFVIAASCASRVLSSISVAAITNDVAEATNRVAMAEGDLTYRRSALSKRLVDIYKRGPLHATEAVLTARSFGELVARYKYLHELAVHDRSLVKRVETLRNDIVRQRADLVKLRDAVEENRGDKLREEERLAILGRMRQTSLQQAQTSTSQIQDRLARIRQSEARLSGVLASIEAERRRTASTRPNAPRAATTLKTTDGKLDWPVEGTFLFRFGRVINPNNTTTRWNGVGIAAALGTPVKSVAPGSVVSVGQLGTYGLTVILDHGGGYFSIYASLNSVPSSLRKGTVLRKGDLIGTVGISDPDLKPHLHFEIRTPPNGNAVDPESWLRGGR